MRDDRCVLVLGGHRQSLAVVRGLAFAHASRIVFGYPGTSAGPGLRRSFPVGERTVAPSLRSTATSAFVDALRAFSRRARTSASYFPLATPRFARSIGYARRLPSQVRYLMASASVLQTCRRKASLFAISRGLGIPVAEYRLATTGRALLEAADAVGYPCVVKAETEELRAFGRRRSSSQTRAQLQEALESQPHVTADARAVSTFPAVRPQSLLLRARPESYAQSLRSRSSEPIVVMEQGMRSKASPSQPTRSGATICTRLASRLRYDGPGCLQFIHDGVLALHHSWK